MMAATTALVIGSILGATATGYSVHEQTMAKKKQEGVQREQDRQIKAQEAEALNKRKGLIDAQRYNLLGTSGGANNTIASGNNGFSLLDNGKTLG